MMNDLFVLSVMSLIAGFALAGLYYDVAARFFAKHTSPEHFLQARPSAHWISLGLLAVLAGIGLAAAGPDILYTVVLFFGPAATVCALISTAAATVLVHTRNRIGILKTGLLLFPDNLLFSAVLLCAGIFAAREILKDYAGDAGLMILAPLFAGLFIIILSGLLGVNLKLYLSINKFYATQK